MLHTAFENMPFLHVEEALLEARMGMFLKQEGPSLQRCRACTGFEKVKIIYKEMGRSEGVVV